MSNKRVGRGYRQLGIRKHQPAIPMERGSATRKTQGGVHPEHYEAALGLPDIDLSKYASKSRNRDAKTIDLPEIENRYRSVLEGITAMNLPKGGGADAVYKEFMKMDQRSAHKQNPAN